MADTIIDKRINSALYPLHLAIRAKHYSTNTEKTYRFWAKDFFYFFKVIDPSQLTVERVGQYLSFLAVRRQISPATQNQALNALVFYFRHVKKQTSFRIPNYSAAKRSERLPVVFTQNEMKRLFQHLDGIYWVICQLLYGGGLRLTKCLTLRIKDIDLDRREILVRDGKGRKDRRTMLPESVVPRLKAVIQRTKHLHEIDLLERFGRVDLPYALANKYPNAASDFRFQYVFASQTRSINQKTVSQGRFQLSRDSVN